MWSYIKACWREGPQELKDILHIFCIILLGYGAAFFSVYIGQTVTAITGSLILGFFSVPLMWLLFILPLTLLLGARRKRDE